jgi:hypothetical protein
MIFLSIFLLLLLLVLPVMPIGCFSCGQYTTIANYASTCAYGDICDKAKAVYFYGLIIAVIILGGGLIFLRYGIKRGVRREMPVPSTQPDFEKTRVITRDYQRIGKIIIFIGILFIAAFLAFFIGYYILGPAANELPKFPSFESPEPIIGSWKVVISDQPTGLSQAILMVIYENHSVEFIAGSNWNINKYPTTAIWHKKRSNLYEISTPKSDLVTILTYDPNLDAISLLSGPYLNWTRVGT